MEQIAVKDTLRFSPDILRRLGEELVPDIDQGIIELVKNAYDADAVECNVALTDLASGSGSMTILDDGTGMTDDNIREGWLVIGRSGKNPKSTTPLYGRIPVGDKGLGRLAALRLGRRVSLVTRPTKQPGWQHELTIDWEAFEKANVVEDVALAIKTKKTKSPPGTEIHIEDISAKIGRATVNKLTRSLLLLSDPFAGFETELKKNTAKRGADPGFKASLLTPEYKDLQAKVGQSYFADAEYRIHAELLKDGTAKCQILDWKGNVLHEGGADKTFDTTTFTFDLWVFVLNSASFSTRSSTLSEVKYWLGHLGGVHLYEDGIRVPPYGGPGNDWLELNLRRVRSPELRPSTNTSVGRVKLSNANRAFVQKTDRVGYIENHAFLELKRCCGEVLDWAARVLVRERDQKQQVEKETKKQRTEKATKKLDRILDKTVPVTERKKVEDAIANYVKVSEKEAQYLREELQLYRSLATAGMTSAVFAHEIGRPLKLIDNAIRALIRLIPEEKMQKARTRVERIATSKERLNSFVSIPLRLLAKQKRRTGQIDANEIVAKLMKLMEPITSYYNVNVQLVLTDQYSFISGSEALLDGVILNLLMNSFNAFQRENFDQAQRKILIQTFYDGQYVSIRVIDNAGGIDDIAVEDIWLPGVTSVPDGTGFGLTIVRDSVSDLGGNIHADPLTDFGGAAFTINLPPMRELFE
jgi:signal transduction histidine kinase